MAENTNYENKSAEKLRDELKRLVADRDRCQMKLIRLKQEEEAREAQEKFLKKRAYELNRKVALEKSKLDETLRETEAHVEDFVRKANEALVKHAHVVETKHEKKKRLEDHDRRRRRYHELQGEVEALAVFKEYQECVLKELDEAKREIERR